MHFFGILIVSSLPRALSASTAAGCMAAWMSRNSEHLRMNGLRTWLNHANVGIKMDRVRQCKAPTKMCSSFVAWQVSPTWEWTSTLCLATEKKHQHWMLLGSSFKEAQSGFIGSSFFFAICTLKFHGFENENDIPHALAILGYHFDAFAYLSFNKTSEPAIRRSFSGWGPLFWLQAFPLATNSRSHVWQLIAQEAYLDRQVW